MNWFKCAKSIPNIVPSILYDENTFYQTFFKDLESCRKEVIIESPFITSSRMEKFYPAFKKMLDRRTKVLIITRDPSDLDAKIRDFATNEIMQMADMGIDITLLKGNHHRKLAIIDRNITWEGSLNILSQNNSIEIMRRIDCKHTAEQLIRFLKLKV
ncbi:MAG: hypothetical protein QG570_18 [Patescibacteria group bacterium]|nr:hypothetical protein [Patescibacteria group bacterium]